MSIRCVASPVNFMMKLTPDNKGTDFGLAQIGQVALRIHDVDGAIEFYRDALGMKFLFSTGTMAFFDCGGVRLMLSMPERPEFDRPGSILYFKVDDLVASRSTMIARGVRFVDEPHLIARMPDHELWMSFFKDPSDNMLALMSEVRA